MHFDLPSIFIAGNVIQQCFLPHCAAISFLISAFVRASVADYESDYPNLRKGLSLAAKFSDAILFESFWLWQQETFPTLLRGRSFLLACCVGRVISCLACFSSYVQTRYPLALETTIGVVGVLVTALTFKVAETLNEPLPQTMAEFKALRKKSKKFF